MKTGGIVLPSEAINPKSIAKAGCFVLKVNQICTGPLVVDVAVMAAVGCTVVAEELLICEESLSLVCSF